MSSWLAIAAIALAALSGLLGLFRSPKSPSGERLSAVLLVAAGATGIASGAWTMMGHPSQLDASWPVPGGRLRLGVDALSAVFVVPTALIGALGAIYGLEYWPQRARRDSGRTLRAFYGLLTAGLMLLIVARNAVLFLVGWEVMALAAFLLITTEDRQASVREVGLVYLLATRVGTLCLFAMFALLGAVSGSLDFDAWAPAMNGPFRDAIFATGLIGFGLKAGLMPLHVWLPGAHASAPSHVSAQMSGVLIKVGIYGLLRITSMCEAPPTWWGLALLVTGAISGILGVGFAIGQHDLKRLLAYHSVENVGIICMGLGVAVVGRSLDRRELITLGVAGAVLHVWNHALFKSLLFLSAGSVLHATGTRELDRLGGLWRRMPRTGMAFLVGAVAICGLPPLNGLVSELLVYLGLFRALTGTPDAVWLVAMLTAAALALIGALALACFVKAFGAVFLGQPRSADVESAHEAGPAMLAPMAVLAALCALIGVGAPLLAPALDAVVASWAGARRIPLGGLAPLSAIAITSGGLVVALAAGGAWVAQRTRGAPAGLGTWDCGYAAPSPRMQYTSSSFAATLVRMLAWALRPARHTHALQGPFPRAASFASHVPDTVLDLALRPAFGLVERIASRVRLLQRGSIHLYLLYILITLLVLLLWA